MHGSIEHGLEIADSKEFMSWPALAGKLRGINVATGNNTCVIAASCFAFHAIKQVSITRASPFFMLALQIVSTSSMILAVQRRIGYLIERILQQGPTWNSRPERERRSSLHRPDAVR
jgi:hypothetical protein